MAQEYIQIESVVKEAICAADKACNHEALQYMKNNLHDVSVATMKHKRAIREPTKRGTKLIKEGWGLGMHPDTWAPDGEGLVLMICLSNPSSQRVQIFMPITSLDLFRVYTQCNCYYFHRGSI